MATTGLGFFGLFMGANGAHHLKEWAVDALGGCAPRLVLGG